MQPRYLIIQTAYIGDVVLTLPVAQVLKNKLDAEVDFLCIPKTSIIVKSSKYVDNTIVYDKHGKDKGYSSFKMLANRIKFRRYDAIISPHRSLRSTLLSYFSKSELTISFDNSTMSFLYDRRIPYKKNVHEIQRNLMLLEPLGIKETEIVKPELNISEEDKKIVELLLKRFNIAENDNFITVAPGTIWYTKQFPPHKLIKVLDLLAKQDIKVIFVGGKGDIEISKYILDKTENKNINIAAGKLNILQSAELIRRSKLILTNDSAPLHLANAVGTKVIAVFGATVPEFGFYPYGKNDVIFETKGLKCRPCSIHGGKKCPIKTFECFERIEEEKIYNEIINSI
ncbi:MAG: glycosyltransferase family 9 protein [Ignavibacteria bacterium]|nr:glycosyltransferase family 9 protein [Ignavibacteria bacterium]